MQNSVSLRKLRYPAIYHQYTINNLHTINHLEWWLDKFLQRYYCNTATHNNPLCNDPNTKNKSLLKCTRRNAKSMHDDKYRRSE